ncbi:Cytochrome c oxidase subunit 6B [Podospora pseudoanserina]|uniref:Cytochrome c oxidase subunit 6B n=1 Tax=Podospora pseudoanserina TaxID=2609844 RepID=A0ABR0IEF0_9PEZI|nr:Cytochrome c oxidase subunit 6B [Podospora pseudoanserina]
MSDEERVTKPFKFVTAGMHKSLFLPRLKPESVELVAEGNGIESWVEMGMIELWGAGPMTMTNGYDGTTTNGPAADTDAFNNSDAGEGGSPQFHVEADVTPENEAEGIITKHCWQNYVDYHKCILAKGEDFAPCRQFWLAYRSLCPSGWYERWDAQREAGNFPVKLE